MNQPSVVFKEQSGVKPEMENCQEEFSEIFLRKFEKKFLATDETRMEKMN